MLDRFENLTASKSMLISQLIQLLALAGILASKGKTAVVSLLYAVNMATVLSRYEIVVQMCVDLQYIGKKVDFNVARGAGSSIYVLSCIALGKLISRQSAELLMWIGIACLVLEAAICLQPKLRAKPIRSPGTAEDTGAASFSEFIRQNRGYFFLFLGTVLVFFGMQVPSNYLINIVRNLGGDESTTGLITGLQAAYEIPVMLGFQVLAKRVKTYTLMKASFLFFMLKSVLFALTSTIPQYCLALAFHGPSYAVFIIASVIYSKEVIRKEDAAKGQALMTNVSLAGAILSGVIGGLLFDNVGSRISLVICAAVTVVGASIAIASLQKPKS